MKLYTVLCLLGSVLLIAAPIGPLVAVEEFLQPKLAYLGIDVSNTPLTADMMMMYDTRYDKSLYRSRLDVTYESDAGTVVVPWTELPFYGWRVPSILFIENVYWNYPVAAEIHALCHQLALLRGPGSSFSVQTDLPAPIAAAIGLNRGYRCR